MQYLCLRSTRILAACLTLWSILTGSAVRADERIELVSRVLPELVSDTAGPGVSFTDVGVLRQTMSADGRYVVFTSFSFNLIPGLEDLNRTTDIFLLDRVGGSLRLVSHATTGAAVAANAASSNPSISADGRYVAFSSSATNLAPGVTNDQNAGEDIFLFDRVTGNITLASHLAGSPNGVPFVASRAPTISADGNWIVYLSRGSGLVTNQFDNNNVDDVFLWSRATNTNTLVTHSSSSTTTEASLASYSPVVNADGSWVAYLSDSNNLVTGLFDTNGRQDVFLWSRATNTSRIVTRTASSATSTGNGNPYNVRISGDGAFVLFLNDGTNYVTGQSDSNGGVDAFLYSRATGTNTLVSRNATSATATGNASLATEGAALSADGNWVGFISAGTNYVTGQVDTNGTGDVFLWSRASGTTELVTRRHGTLTTASASPNASPANIEITANGAFLLYNARGTELVAGQSDTNQVLDLFFFDRAAGANTLISGAGGSATATADYASGTAMLSGDGNWIAFLSSATDLVSGIVDGNGGDDLFLHDRASHTTTLVSWRDPARPSDTPGSSSTVPSFGNANTVPSLSADGRYLAFESGILLPGQKTPPGGGNNVYLYDRLAGIYTLVTRSYGTEVTSANGESRFPVISSDGRWVAFHSRATDLVPGQNDTNFADDVFLWDRVSGEMRLVSHAAGNPALAAGGSNARINADGSAVIFHSTASNLVAGLTDTFLTTDVFLYDRTTGESTLVSRRSTGPLVTAGFASESWIDAAGRFVSFLSTASNVITGQTETISNSNDLFLWDRTTGEVALVSSSATSATAAVGASVSALSADGNWLAFSSTATNWISGLTDTNSQADIFLWERATGARWLVSRSAASATTTANNISQGVTLNADGSRVVFLSRATNLVAGGSDTNNFNDVFVYDRSTGQIALASHTTAGPQIAGNSLCTKIAISADGSKAAFLSAATNLVAGQTDVSGTNDVFLYDVATGEVKLLSHKLSSPTAAVTSSNSADFAAPNANGSVVPFSTLDADIVPNDYNFRTDLFLWINESGTDLAIAKTNGVSSVVPGQAVAYTITAINSGPTPTGATVTDTFPAAFQGATWTCVAGGGASCGAASGAGSLAQSVNLPVNGTVTFTVTGTVAADATGTLANTASITPTGGVTDPNLTNNAATDADPLTPQADLSISMTDAPDPVQRGTILTYLISVTNAGPSAAASVTLTDTLPAGTTFAGAAGTGWSCAPAGGAVTCTRPSLAPGSAPALTIQAIAPITRGIPTLTNTAALSAATSDPVTANNAASATTSVLQPGITVAPTTGLTTTEAGGTASFSVGLDTPPLADVTILLASSDTAEGTVSPAALTFTTSDWSTPQTVTVTGVNDDYDDGDAAFTITTGAAASTDTGYAGIDPADVAVSNQDDDTAGFLVTPAGGLTTTEAGGTATFTVVLTSRPRAGVSVDLASSDTAEGTVSPASLTFGEEDWSTPQTVTVTGVNDDYDDGDTAYTITTAAAASTDTGYAGIDPADVAVSNQDDDTAGFVIAPTAGLTTSEAGGTATFTVVLTSRPRADVTIPLASSDTAEGTVSPASLTFTEEDWSTPQTVTVTGVNDDYDDGDAAFTITTGAAGSTDTGYAGIDPADVAVSNQDDDTAGIVITPAEGLTTTEAGGTATFTVVLAARPRADVTIALTSDDTDEGTVDPASLTFTSEDWNTPRTVTVTGVDDDYADGDVAYAITTGAAQSTDAAWAGLDPADVAFTNEDDDTAGIVVTPTAGLITTERGGTATFTVVLAARPAEDVTIALTSSDSGEGQPSPASLTFTSDNWDTPRTVTVTGQDDDLRDGDVAYTITLAPAESGDPAFDGIDPADVTATNRDDTYEGVFHTITQCRLVDTRQPGYGPPLQNNQVAIIAVHGACGIPTTARAVSMNLTFSGAGQPGTVLVYPGDLAQPPVNEYLWIRAGVVARSLWTLMPLGSDGTLAVLPRLKAPRLNPTVHIILDVSGYFE